MAFTIQGNGCPPAEAGGVCVAVEYTPGPFVGDKGCGSSWFIYPIKFDGAGSSDEF